MVFRLEIFQVGRFFTSWSLTKLQDFGTQVYLAIRESTFFFALTKTDSSISVDLREKRKKKFIFLSPLTLRPSPLLLFFFFLLTSIFFFLSFSFLFLKKNFGYMTHIASCSSLIQVRFCPETIYFFPVQVILNELSSRVISRLPRFS